MKTETERWIEQWLALATGRMIVWQTKWKRKKFFFYCLAARSSSLVFCSALTHNIQVAHLAFHWIRIYLAHVPGKRRKKEEHHRMVMQAGSYSAGTYQPLSDSLISLMRIVQVLCSELAMPILWFLVITWFCIVRIVCVSTRNHATCVGKVTAILGVTRGV